jgi:hypothetical protein
MDQGAAIRMYAKMVNGDIHKLSAALNAEFSISFSLNSKGKVVMSDISFPMLSERWATFLGQQYASIKETMGEVKETVRHAYRKVADNAGQVVTAPLKLIKSFIYEPQKRKGIIVGAAKTLGSGALALGIAAGSAAIAAPAAAVAGVGAIAAGAGAIAVPLAAAAVGATNYLQTTGKDNAQAFGSAVFKPVKAVGGAIADKVGVLWRRDNVSYTELEVKELILKLRIPAV